MNFNSTQSQKSELPRRTYSVAEVANQLGISQSKVRKELRAGRMAFIRIGRRVLVADEHLKKYIESRVVAGFDASFTAKAILGSSAVGKF